jgi:hypothetical protein
MVRQDETGIVYCLPQLVAWLEPGDLTIKPPGGSHRHAARIAHGRVTACIVGSRPGDETEAMRTKLVVAPIGAYR